MITYTQLSLFLQSLPDLETLPTPVGLPFPAVLVSFGCNDTTQHHKAVGLEQQKYILSQCCVQRVQAPSQVSNERPSFPQWAPGDTSAFLGL